MRGQVKLQSGDTKGGCNDLSKANDLGDSRSQKFLHLYCAGVETAKPDTRQNEYLKIDWPGAEGRKVANNQKDNEKTVIELLRNSETFENWTS